MKYKKYTITSVRNGNYTITTPKGDSWNEQAANLETAKKWVEVDILRINNMEDEPLILKAFDGDRAKNLESIAEAIENILDFSRRELNENTDDYENRIVDDDDIHTIKGYMEQLRIIADEWRKEHPSI